MDSIVSRKIFDQMLVSEQKPSVVILYLKQFTDTDLLLLFKESFYFHRIFQLDFFLLCEKDEVSWLMHKLPLIPRPYALPLIWQILKSNSVKANSAKYDYRKIIDAVLKKGNMRHPYAFGNGNNVKDIDSVIIDLCQKNQVIELPNIIGKENFTLFMQNIGYSLFAGRIAQLDFMLSLPDYNTMVFYYISGILRSAPTYVISKFIRQVFDSRDVDISVKLYLRSLLIKQFKAEEGLSSENMLEEFEKYRSFQEFYLTCEIQDNLRLKKFVNSIGGIIWMLLYKIEWIRDWINIDRSAVDSILICSDIAEACREEDIL